MRVTVDHEKCCGHARCLTVAPAAFDYDEVNEVAVVTMEANSVSGETLRQAVQACPERAISLVGESSE